MIVKEIIAITGPCAGVAAVELLGRALVEGHS
jgi:hypothetical protein